MPDQPDQPPTIRLPVTETPVPGVLLGHQPVLADPADPVIGLTTDEDGDW